MDQGDLCAGICFKITALSEKIIPHFKVCLQFCSYTAPSGPLYVFSL